MASHQSLTALIRRIKPKNLLVLLFASFLPAYAGYICFMQPYSPVVSKTSLALAGLIWLGLFFLSWDLTRGASPLKLFTRRSLPGILGVLILANLYLYMAQIPIPYPYFLLPSQRVAIQPLTLDRPIQIHSFTSENQDWIDLLQFKESAGWRAENLRTTYIQGERGELVWQGKPGRFVEIQFTTCADCGRVRVSGQGFASQEFDLSQPGSASTTIAFRHEYPSLVFLKWINLLIVEAALLLVSALLIQLFNLALVRFTDRAQPAGAGSGNRKVSGALPVLALAALTVFTYVLKLRPVLFNDDWLQIIYDLNFKILQPFMLNVRRPLHLTLVWLAGQFFPLDQTVVAVYAIQLLIVFLSAVLTYALLRQLLEGREWFAFLVAALWLVFPNDYTVLYITMLGGRLAYLLMLVVMLLLLRMVKNGGLLDGLLAPLVLVTSLWVYEGQLGILALWPVLLVARYRTQLTRRKLVGFAGFYLAFALFIVWRLFFQPDYYQDTKLDVLGLPVMTMLGRYFDALRTILGGFQFPYADNRWFSAESYWVFGLLLLGWVAVFIVAWRLSRSKAAPGEAEPALINRLAVLGLGLLLWAAGYFPLLWNFPANIYGHLSRVNLYCNLGAAILLVSIFEMIASSISRVKIVAVSITALATLYLVAAGSLVQFQVQYSINQTWSEAGVFYRALAEQVPNLKPDTQLVVILSGYDDLEPPRRPLFTTPWEASAALRSFYNQADLEVGYHYDNMLVPPFPSFNILGATLYADSLPTITDLSRLLVIRYDNHTRQLTILGDPGDLLPIQSATGSYAPAERIVPLAAPVPARAVTR